MIGRGFPPIIYLLQVADSVGRVWIGRIDLDLAESKSPYYKHVFQRIKNL